MDKTELPTKLKLENTMDTSGKVVCGRGVIRCSVAGIIIYRAADNEIRTALNDILPAPASSLR